MLPLDALKDFIKTVPPFHLLSGDTVDELVGTLIIEYFPRGEIILRPEGPAASFLYIIRSGGVRLLSKDGDGLEKVYDYREEGDFFGLLSLLGGEPSPFTIIAEEDTLCYLLRKEVFKNLLDTNPDVFLYFTAGPSKGFKQHAGGMVPEPLATQGLEVQQVLFTGRVREVMHPEVLTCPPDETIVGVARRMTGRGVGSVIVVDDLGIPMGIVTDGDFRGKILAKGTLINVPVIDIMSKPVQAISPDAFCFEAIVSMIINQIKYLIVMDGLKLLGILSEHDLMVSQGNNPVAVIKGIEQASSIDQVVAIRTHIDRAMKVILHHGGMARDLSELITTLNDHLTRKIILLAEEAMFSEGLGRPPVPYSWIALGSEGRREQTLRTDQDNAIVFADVLSEREEEVKRYFLDLAGRVVSGLERCGFPRCKGGIMAVNPKWCQPFRVWKEYYRHWIVDIDHPAEEILQTMIFFDFRSLYGSYDFSTRIAGFISEYLNQREGFLRDMAGTAVFHETPLGFFKRFVVEKSGQHKNQLNLKVHGLTPLVDAVRILALAQRIFETNTLDRISTLLSTGALSQGEADDLRDAFNVIMLTRIRHHVSLISRAEEPDNYINPEDLSIIQRTMLKEAFKAIDKLQRTLELHYGIND